MVEWIGERGRGGGESGGRGKERRERERDVCEEKNQGEAARNEVLSDCDKTETEEKKRLPREGER